MLLLLLLVVVVVVVCMLVNDINNCIVFRVTVTSAKGLQLRNSLLAISGVFTAMFINEHHPC